MLKLILSIEIEINDSSMICKLLKISAAVCISIMLCSCARKEAEIQLSQLPEMFPDYAGVTVPSNIAPLNFMVKGAKSILLDISISSGETISFTGKESISIPQRRWEYILQQSQGKDIKFTVSVWNKKYPNGAKYNSFSVHVSKDKIDPWIVYRLTPPGYEGYKYMAIYERNLSSFTTLPIVENTQFHLGCVNCHSFADYHPNYFMFHARGTNGGTIIYANGKIEKHNIKKDSVMGASYNSWHPSGKYIAFSSNITRQSFYGHSRDKIEVYDLMSDLMIYDVNTRKVYIDDRFNDSINLETFPSFSPDGRYLYFCTSKIAKLPMEYNKLHYSIVRVPFNEDGSLGETFDTIYNARTEGGSALFPRVSPDGKFMLFTWAECGAFHLYHKEADLKMLDLTTNTQIPIDIINSNDVDSYHSWSSNGKWIVFSSKRVDSRYTRLFVTHWDGKQFTKPFIIPQENPKDDVLLLYSYNIPEFLREPVDISKDKMAKMFE